MITDPPFLRRLGKASRIKCPASAPPISSATCSNSPTVRPSSATEAPARAKAMLVARPIPEPAPVTRARFPCIVSFNNFIIFHCSICKADAKSQKPLQGLHPWDFSIQRLAVNLFTNANRNFADARCILHSIPRSNGVYGSRCEMHGGGLQISLFTSASHTDLSAAACDLHRLG